MNTLCVHCRQPLKFGQESIGREFPCPRCGGPLKVDASGITAPQAAGNNFANIAEVEEDDEPIRRKSRKVKRIVKSRGGNTFVDFLMFRGMLTPLLIQACFWSGSVICLAAGLLMVANSFEKEPPALKFGNNAFDNPRGAVNRFDDAPAARGTKVSYPGVVSGLSLMIFGPLLLRIYCECLIIFFRIHEELCDLHTTMARKG